MTETLSVQAPTGAGMAVAGPCDGHVSAAHQATVKAADHTIGRRLAGRGIGIITFILRGLAHL